VWEPSMVVSKVVEGGRMSIGGRGAEVAEVQRCRGAEVQILSAALLLCNSAAVSLNILPHATSNHMCRCLSFGPNLQMRS
jgi:hypothetical protein